MSRKRYAIWWGGPSVRPGCLLTGPLSPRGRAAHLAAGVVIGRLTLSLGMPRVGIGNWAPRRSWSRSCSGRKLFGSGATAGRNGAALSQVGRLTQVQLDLLDCLSNPADVTDVEIILMLRVGFVCELFFQLFSFLQFGSCRPEDRANSAGRC